MSVQQSSQILDRKQLVPAITRESVLAVVFMLLMVTSVLAMGASPAMLSSPGASEGVLRG